MIRKNRQLNPHMIDAASLMIAALTLVSVILESGEVRRVLLGVGIVGAVALMSTSARVGSRQAVDVVKRITILEAKGDALEAENAALRTRLARHVARCGAQHQASDVDAVLRRMTQQSRSAQ